MILNKISIDVDGVINSMMPWLKKALDYAEEALIEEMKNEIDMVSDLPSDWRRVLKGHIKHMREEITQNAITYFAGPGYKEDPESGLWMRAMVIAFGMERPIYAGPYGAEVWDDDLWSRKKSEVTYRHEIPKKWYHDGRNYIENSLKNIRVRYADLILTTLENMPDSIFSKNVIVKEGG